MLSIGLLAIIKTVGGKWYILITIGGKLAISLNKIKKKTTLLLFYLQLERRKMIITNFKLLKYVEIF